MTLPLSRPQLLATMVVAGFFFLLLWFYVTNVYQLHFFNHGGVVVAWQGFRLLYIPYLIWLQYVVGAWVLTSPPIGGRLRGGHDSSVGANNAPIPLRQSASGDTAPTLPLMGREFFITSFLIGTAIWHIVLLATGLAGLDTYPVMLALAGGVMVASWKHLADVIPAFERGSRATSEGSMDNSRPPIKSGVTSLDEKLLALLVVIAALAFIFLKGAYPSGGHDFFNHYFTYYKEVVSSGSLGPHGTWYQYFYSKGLGLYFLSMILLDPLAVHLVGAAFTLIAACMVFDLLREPGRSLLLPLWGVLLYFLCYTYTPGRGLFAANGGWGDLEKTHELAAVLTLACLWLTHHALKTRHTAYEVALHLTNVALMIISFGSLLIVGLFYALLLVWSLVKRDWPSARLAFFAGLSLGAATLAMMLINYITTGIPQDQLVYVLWPIIDWQRVVANGYTLELYSNLSDHMALTRNSLPLWKSAPKMLIEYFRLYMLWPLAAVGVLLALTRPRRCSFGVLLIFLLGSFIAALFFGGRSQPISFFRFSTFNYAPALIACLLLWRCASERLVKYAVRLCLIAAVPLIFWQQPQVIGGWYMLGRSALALNTGNYSLRDAIIDQRGRVGRLRWGGIYPAMEAIYSALPPGTRIWSMHNHSYCLLPACHVDQYFSQTTSPRWYDIALGGVEEGKKIMQSEGLNFIFYSRSVPVVNAADAKDQLAGFYDGLSPEHIGRVYGILWSNGWDYLLTWKEESIAPLDAEFMDSWRLYHKKFVEPRQKMFPTKHIARMVKEAAENPDIKHPPVPDW